MLRVIQALYLLSILALVAYLFLDFRKHQKIGRHLLRSWTLFVGHSIAFPLTMYGLFGGHPEALSKFFPDGPIGPHNVAWFFAGWLVGLILFVLFIGIMWAWRCILTIYTNIIRGSSR